MHFRGFLNWKFPLVGGDWKKSFVVPGGAILCVFFTLNSMAVPVSITKADSGHLIFGRGHDKSWPSFFTGTLSRQLSDA
ncbi:unnamed protein product [Victoria cruziana]